MEKIALFIPGGGGETNFKCLQNRANSCDSNGILGYLKQRVFAIENMGILSKKYSPKSDPP
jgi:hypothetical protein